MGFKNSNFTTLNDFSREDLQNLLDLARQFKDQSIHRSLTGKTVAALFLSPSLQSRIALDSACHELGAHLIFMGASEPWSLATDEGKPMYGAVVEHVKDAAATLSSQVDAIALRTQGKMENFGAVREAVPFVLRVLARHPAQVVGR